MAFYTYTFTHYAQANSAATVLTNVTSTSERQGKTSLFETVQSSTGQINGINPSALPTIRVGDWIQGNTGTLSLGGLVANFQVYYGKDPDEDRWTITFEDAIAILGRTEVTVSWSAGVTTQDAIMTVAQAAGVDYLGLTTDTSKSRVSAQSFTNTNALQIIRQIEATEQGSIIAGAFISGIGNPITPAINPLGRGVITTAGRFNDGSSTALVNTDFRYESLDFAALADNYAQKVIVEPAGLAAQTAGSGNRVYTLQTYDETTAQAAQLAQYVDTILSGQTAGPERVAVIMEAQVSPTFPTDATTILLRSNTYTANVLGREIQADPTATRVAWSLAPGATTNWLVLDNATLGTLDNNRLGF